MKKALLTAVILTLFFALTGCGQLDVIGKGSVKSFEAILTAMDDKVISDDKNGGWSLNAPDDTIRFIWSKDYSKSPLYDVMLEIEANSFLNAGLDTSKLPDTIMYAEDKIVIGTKLGNDALTYNKEATPLASYEQIVNNYRRSVGYHTSLDHYNVDLGNGNMFEWAKDLSINTNDKSKQDKDIVFVLDPAPFIAAGVDPEKIEGWTFAKVTVDLKGKPTEVDKLLKPFDLR